MEKVRTCTPFVRVDNQKLRFVSSDPASHAFSSLSDLGLYMMLSAILSNPSFVSAGGGMQNLLLRHCRNRYFSLHASWNRLTAAGYLKRTRMPLGHNRFHDAYTLTSAADPVQAPVVHLSYAEGVQYRGQYQPFLPPQKDFTAVSYPMLMDERLSLSAKGLYAVIARLLRLSEYQPSVVVSKAMLRPLCGEGKNAFDALLRELRVCGYLSLLRGWDPDAGKIRFVYCLNPDGNRTVSVSAVSDKDDAVLREKQGSEAPSADPAEDASVPGSVRSAYPAPDENTGACSPAQKMTGKHGHIRITAENLPMPLPIQTDLHTNAMQTGPVSGGISSSSSSALPPPSVRPMDEIRKDIRTMIEYPVLLQEYTKEKLDAVVSILSDAKREAVLYPDRTDNIGGETVLKRELWDRYSQLDSEDIRFVLDAFREAARTTRIRRVRRYLTACLYHAKENMALALDVFSDRLPV